MRQYVRIAVVISFASTFPLGACERSETATPTAPPLTLATKPSAARASDNVAQQERAVLPEYERIAPVVEDWIKAND